MKIRELLPMFAFFLGLLVVFAATNYGARRGYEAAQKEVLCWPDIFYWESSEKHPAVFKEVEEIARKSNMGSQISFPRRVEERTPNKWAF